MQFRILIFCALLLITSPWPCSSSELPPDSCKVLIDLSQIENVIMKIQLKNGKKVFGKLSRMRPDSVDIVLEDGDVRAVNLGDIKSITKRKTLKATVFKSIFIGTEIFILLLLLVSLKTQLIT